MNQIQEEALMPSPDNIKVGGIEIIVRPLPVKKLLSIIKELETDVKGMQDLGILEGDDASISGVLSESAYPRLNKLIRQFVPEQEKLLTDEWCSDHLSNAHYWAIIKAALRQNKLSDLFRLLGDSVIKDMQKSFQQTMKLSLKE